MRFHTPILVKVLHIVCLFVSSCTLVPPDQREARLSQRRLRDRSRASQSRLRDKAERASERLAAETAEERESRLA